MCTMPLVPEPGVPVSIPPLVHAALWPALVGWIVFLVRRRRRRAWPCLSGFGLSLIPACVLTDAAALIAAYRWPSSDSNSFVFALLWLAILFSVTAYFALRTPDDPGWSDDDADDQSPEPPWWPDFERDLRDYMRRGPRQPAKPPKTPAGVA
jgi:hypothetical protein